MRGTHIVFRAVMHLCVATLIIIGFLPQASAGTRHAILIGVSDYHASVAQLAPRLNGPGNDVALMYDLVTDAGFGAANITILTNQPELLSHSSNIAASQPTRRAIMDALERLTDRVSPGDDVLLYVAGHGAQLPNQSTDRLDDEPDGLDEVFLPSDFEIVDENGTRLTKNEIRDDEIGAIIDRLLAQGAHVWLIADTCHAGTLRRGNGEWLIPRQLTLLDDTVVEKERAQDNMAGLVEPRQTAGRFVAFYGADAGALAYETRIDGDNDPGDGVVHGVMTWGLAQAIRAGAQDYRELARLTREAVWTATAGRARPAFSGVLGGAPLLGEAVIQDLVAPVEVHEDALVLNAGLLDGVANGLPVQLGFRNINGESVPLAEGYLAQTDLSAALFELPDFGSPDAEALDREIASEGLDPNLHRMRWLEARAPSLFGQASDPAGLRKHPFVTFENEGASGEDATRISATLLDMPSAETALRERDGFTINLDEDSAVLALEYHEADRVIRAPATPQGMESLQVLIQRVHRAREIARIGEELSRRAASSALITDVTIEPSTDPGCAKSPKRIDDASRLMVRHCDRINVNVTNRGSETLDVTPLYLAPDGKIFFLTGYAWSERGGLRVAPGETKEVVYREEIAPKAGEMTITGIVKLLFLAVTAQQDGRPPVDFRYLQTTDTRDALRAVPPRSATRSLNSLAALIRLTIVPPESEFGRVD